MSPCPNIGAVIWIMTILTDELTLSAFFIGIVGVVYQFVGLTASERELGMTQIIEASMPNKRRWEPQAVRLLANHLAFDVLFLPGEPR